VSEVLQEAFRYSAWATRTLIAVCRQLSAEQRERPARGFGSVLATLNHVVLTDADYATILGGVRPAWATAGNTTGDLDEIERRADENARLWERVFAQPFDAERRLVLDSGTYECRASLVVVEALQHASGHREQIRAGVAELGVKPPDIQPWEFAIATGRSRWLRDPK
jgi:uncharacterized damage-inducible protein DinB